VFIEIWERPTALAAANHTPRLTGRRRHRRSRFNFPDEKIPLFLRAAGKFRLCESGAETGRLTAHGQEIIRRRFAMRRFAAAFVSMLPFVAIAADIPDLAFYRDAAEGGLAEVAMGNMAQQQAHSQSVREFGALMVKDHSAANEKLKAIAESKNITLPANTSVDEMAAKEKLKALSGSSFDKSYIKGMIKDHQEDIAEFKKEAASGRDPDARAFASATLPTLEAHLKKIQAIAAEAGVSADKSN
jgi:putative membrane protein